MLIEVLKKIKGCIFYENIFYFKKTFNKPRYIRKDWILGTGREKYLFYKSIQK